MSVIQKDEKHDKPFTASLASHLSLDAQDAQDAQICRVLLQTGHEERIPLSAGLPLHSYSKDCVDERERSQALSGFNIVNLACVNPAHCLLTRERAPSPVECAKSEARLDASFQESMLLLDDIRHIPDLSGGRRLGQGCVCVDFLARRRIGGLLIDGDASGVYGAQRCEPLTKKGVSSLGSALGPQPHFQRMALSLDGWGEVLPGPLIEMSVASTYEALWVGWRDGRQGLSRSGLWGCAQRWSVVVIDQETPTQPPGVSIRELRP